MAITKIPAAGFTGNNFRNIIINGDMSIAQRGTSATGLTNGSAGYHTVDRWRLGEGGSPTAEFTQSQSTDVPSGQGFATSLKMDCTTAQASLGADDQIFIEQRIEGQNLQYLKKGTSNAQSLTASFWVKSNKTGDFSFTIYDNDNTRVIGNTYTINSADTWEKKTITFAGDTTGTLDNDNDQSFRIWLNLFAGTNRSNSSNTSWQSFSSNGKQAYGQTVNLADSTANEWYITGVQLEAGTVASDFEFLPFDVQLNRCKRYFQKSMPYSVYSNSQYGAGYVTVDTSSALNNQAFGLEYPVEFRATPTLTVYRLVDGTSGSMYGHVGASSVTASPVQAGAKQVGYFTMGTNANNFYSFNYRADAEL